MESMVIFGGSFNPVHNGHVRMAEEIRRALRPDRFVVMPVCTPPHKPMHDMAADIHRLNMCRLAFDEHYEVSDFEINRRRISYTYETVEHFNQTLADTKIYLAIGSDMLLSFDRWKRYKDILSMASLVAVSRADGDMDELNKKKLELSEYGEVIVLTIEPYPMSSTIIRGMIKSNRLDGLDVPDAVKNYIIENSLYGCD